MSKSDEPKKRSRAPAPITPLRGTGGIVQIPKSASRPDWKFWLTQKTVALWEAAYLTYGIDPESDNYRDIRSFGIENEKVAKRARTLENHLGNLNTQTPLLAVVALGLSLGWRRMPLKLGRLAIADVVGTRTETNTSTNVKSTDLVAAVGSNAANKWQDEARRVADKLHHHDKANGAHSSIRDIADRVAQDLRGRGILGPRGPLRGNSIMREALQGGKWKRPF